MPILNPQQAYNIWNSCDLKRIDLLMPFLQYLLPIASKNVHLNRKTDETHYKLKKMLIDKFDTLKSYFKLQSEDIQQLPTIETSNIYDYLLKIVQIKIKDENKNFPFIDLSYAGYALQYGKNTKIQIKKKVDFYIPYKDSRFGFFISNESYAIFSYEFNNTKYFVEDVMLIRIVLSVLIGSGYLVIYCFYDNAELFSCIEPLFDLSLFAEIHIFTEKNTNNDNSLAALKDYIYAHTYIYIHFDKIVNDDVRKKITKYKSQYVHIYVLSKKFGKILSAPKSLEMSNTDIDIDTFSKNSYKNQITLNLCNVTLYKSNDKENDWTPVKVSGVTTGIISADDFQYSHFKRISIKINRNEKYLDQFYIEFPELHLMNPELYVKEPMYLSKQNIKVSVVEQISNCYKKKENIFDAQTTKSQSSFFYKNKLHHSFHYIHKFCRNEKNEQIEPYQSQIYAVYQAMLAIKNESNKGCILQVHTGEGKSLIVQALAEILAREGNIVHVATSNILLAVRDFQKGYDFFKQCDDEDNKLTIMKKRPTILLHESELKYIEGFIKDKDEFNAFYSKKSFNKSSNLNTSVFQKNGTLSSNIIYSTFLNFEAYYLSQFDNNTSYIGDYLNNAYLIIDEADTILIDELINGTILSKPMNSSVQEVLENVYKTYMSGKHDNCQILDSIVDNFPEYNDIIKDKKGKENFLDCIEQMIADIKLVNSKDFLENNKYIIEKDQDGTQRIIPFDSEHKGISEPSKEFNGFIHQFIAIKEKFNNPKEYENLEIQPLSMNYLFISHPIYVKKYKGVCGVTGTIGKKYDKEILEKYYSLVTQKVPRNEMNLRKDLPMILCENIKDRNIKICTEIKRLHEMLYPVLVVFNDINELNDLNNILTQDEYGINKSKINIFTGKNSQNVEKEKLILEENAGENGQITLGTNFCGRGVSINFKDLPLFVIVTYYNYDNRSLNQALGRSGRNGNFGITRIICTKEMFYKGTELPSDNVMKAILDDYQVKNILQERLVNEISINHEWIFNEVQYNKLLTKKEIQELRKYTININRITACKYKFPVYMDIDTFLNIQSQRIYSLKNCPECRQTWNLFRIYLRELILESWSLFLNSLDKNYKKMINNNFIFDNFDYSGFDKDKLYTIFCNTQYEKFKVKINKYIPNRKLTVTELFIRIHNIVGSKWERKILRNISDQIIAKRFTSEKNDCNTVFKVGFFPLSLAQNSGVKISPLTDSEKEKAEKQMLYIVDLELRYIKKNGEPFSITNVLDKIFDSFRKMVDDKLNNLFGLRFFLKRTLIGCEFGICIDPSFECKDYHPNSLIDQNPIILFTICTKSSFCWIAGILIMLLIFATGLITLIVDHLVNKGGLTKKILEKIKNAAMNFLFGGDSDEEGVPFIEQKARDLVNHVLDSLIEKLQEKITQNINDYDIGLGFISNTMLKLFSPIFNHEIFNNIFKKIKINDKILKILKSTVPAGKLIIVAILIIILLAQFILNFRNRPRVEFNSCSQKTAEKYQKEYNKDSNKDITYFKSYNKMKNILEPKKKEKNKRRYSTNSDSDFDYNSI